VSNIPVLLKKLMPLRWKINRGEELKKAGRNTGNSGLRGKPALVGGARDSLYGDAN
jgi:hypothetical protein